MKNLLITLIIICVLFTTAVAQQTTVRKLDDFSSVSIGEAIELVLVPGNRNQAEISSKNVDLDEVQTTVSGDRLKIGLRGNRYRNIAVEITLTYKDIDRLQVSSAARVTTRGTIKAKNLQISVASAGNTRLEVDTGELDIDVSSSGELMISGETIVQRVSVSSAGAYKGYELESQQAFVRASSAGMARVKAIREIDGKANSAGSIKYTGDPEKARVSSSSGGSASKAN